MTTINDLCVTSSVSSDDKLPLWQNANGVTRALPISVLDSRYLTQEDVALLAISPNVEIFKANVDFTPGVSLALTLANQYMSASNVEVFFDASFQGPDQYSIAGYGMVFTSPIPDGVSSVYVRGGISRLVGAPSDGTVTTPKLVDGSVTTVKLADGAVTGDKIQQAASGAFWTGNGAKVNRFNDRVFVGGATVNDGAFPNLQPDWLAQYQSYFYPGNTPPTVTTLMNVLGATSGTGAAEPFLVGAQTQPATGAFGNAIAVQGYAIANNTSFGNDFSWAFYGEGHRAHAGSGNCYGMEICVVNRGDIKALTPYFNADGATIGIQIDSGCGFRNDKMPDLASASAAMVIIDNTGDATHAGTAPFLNGIVFQAGSIQDSFGNHSAIVLPKDYRVLWYSPDNNPSSYLTGSVNDHTKSTGIVFNDFGLQVQNASNQILAAVPPIANAVNYVQIDANITGGTVGISAQGSDANIHVRVIPKGTGSVQLGATFTAGAVSQTGYVTMLDAGGTPRRFLIG
jgi:hypothetical protein